MSIIYFYHPDWPVFYEDNHLLVLYKPAGLLVQGDKTGDISLLELGKQWLKDRYQKPGNVFLGMVHRLDRPVAGVIVFCRTSKAASRISSQFRSGKTHKRYLAITEGELHPRTGVLTDFIERRGDRSSRVVSEHTDQAKAARLNYEVLDFSGSRSLVEIRLETGRKHQIRLQLAHLGHPIVGDLRYGASAPLSRGQIALLAHELSVIHPVKNTLLDFQCPLPRGWPWPPGTPHSGGPPWNWCELNR